MINEIYSSNGAILERKNDSERTVTTYDQVGEILSVRPYTQEENDATDAALAAQAEERARIEKEQIQAAIVEATVALMETAHTDGEVWTQPTGAHNAYKVGVTVEHNGKTWENITHANVWEPGVSGWREVLPDGEIGAWIQPTGAHDAYAKGAVVTHNEFTWVSDVDDNVWEPGVYGWTKQ